MYVLDVPFFLCAKDYAAQEQVNRLKIDQDDGAGEEAKDRPG